MEHGPDPSRRAFKVKIGDQVEVEVATEQEVIALLRAAGILTPDPASATTTPPAPRPTKGRAFADFLRFLAVQGKINLQDVPELLGLKGTKGLSPFLAAWGRYFDEHGIQLDRVVQRKQNRQRRRWLEPGPDIQAGIEVAEVAPD